MTTRPSLAALALLALAACAEAPVTRPAQPLGPGPRPAPVAAKAPAEPWWKTAVFYEVFVRSFQDSDGDGIGDFRGLTAKLDYLNDGDPNTTSDLGVDALWLMPMLESPSYHGYDVTDYDHVEKDYGTEADFDAFVRAAHARGIHVIIDLVLNHASSKHPWFLDAASSKTSRHRDWFVWSDRDLGWGQPWNEKADTWHEAGGSWFYGLFWEGMPDLNWRNAEVRAEARRFAHAWLARGVDGFRLDAIRYLVEDGPGPGQSSTPETFTYLFEFAKAVREAKPDAYLVGEVWAGFDEAAQYYGKAGEGLSAMFDFPLAGSVVSAATAGDPSSFTKAAEETLRVLPPGATDAPFLTNHDMRRIGSMTDGDPAKLKLAASLLLTLPGTPFLYYGEEIGMENGPGGADEQKRTPMRWDAAPLAGFTTGKPWFAFSPARPDANVAAQANDPGSLLSRYRALLRARKASPALSGGDLALLPRVPGVRAVAFLRRGGGETVLVVHNLGATPVDLPSLQAPGATAEPVFVDAGASLVREEGGLRARLAPRSTAAWRLR
ncbi:MAG: alpha-amylase family glycosyl hydrolase [Anaeromyxobacter sp.]